MEFPKNTRRTDIGSIRNSADITQLSMWQVDVPPGPRPENRHNHMQFELGCVLSGNGTYRTETGEYPMAPGDLFVFASSENHCITSVGPYGLSLLNLHFAPQYLWGNSCDRMKPENLNFCFSHSPSFVCRIEAGRAVSLSAEMNQIRREFTEKRDEYELMIKSLLNGILIALIREHNYSDGSVVITRKNLHSIRDAINYIDQHITEPLSLADIAAAAKLSPSYFCKYFRRVSHLTLWEYIGSRRIALATRLLGEKDSSTMLEIALRCGFNNTANFNKMFLKYTGMTPREYTRSLMLLPPE